MMTKKLRLLPHGLLIAAAIAFVLPAGLSHAQTTPAPIAPGSAAPAMPETAAPAQSSPAKTPSASPIKIDGSKAGEAAKAAGSASPLPERAQAYYHAALASSYEEKAVSEGRQEFITRAIEEYKLALNADPASPQLNLALADLYFRTGHAREAENTVRELLKSAPDNVDAHKLLGDRKSAERKSVV